MLVIMNTHAHYIESEHKGSMNYTVNYAIMLNGEYVSKYIFYCQ